MYKMQKVFDCQDMPLDVRLAFYEYYRDDTSNHSYVQREVYSEAYWHEEEDGSETLRPCEDYTIFDAWLSEHGAREGEYVLVHFWW